MSGIPSLSTVLTPWYLIVHVLISVSLVGCIPIDNGVIGTSVQCTSDAIVVNFTTRNPFSGRIFVKGMSDRPECVRSYFDGGPTPATPLISFTFGACNMLRSRTLSPQPGMLQMIVVVISFHRIFVTKVDRAYKVQCFYTETEKTVTSQLEVSMLSTESVRDTQSMPTCVYEVRRGSQTGDIVRYANIGEPVYHEWECKSDQVKMLVKNCYVDDGQGNKQQIMDERGCSLDSYILSDLTYDTTGNAKAWVESHVFKYADKSSLFFQCTIQLCARGDPQCNAISPPVCAPRSAPPTAVKARVHKERLALSLDNGTRVRRSGDDARVDGSRLMEMDLMTDSISVMDLDVDRPYDRHGRKDVRTGPGCQKEENAVCLSPTGFAFLLAAIMCLFVSTVVTALYIHLKWFFPTCKVPKRAQ